MLVRYMRVSLVAGVLFAAVFYWFTITNMTEELPSATSSPSYTPTAGQVDSANNEKASKPENWPQWLDGRLKEAEQAGQWRAAAEYADRLAVYYRSIGHEDEAQTWYSAGEGYREKDPVKDRRFYDDTPPNPNEVTMSMYVSVPAPPNDHLAKYEPKSGAYLGMFGVTDLTSIESTFGRYHAISLTYVGWRRDERDTRNYFPTTTVNRVKAAGGGAVQIGWEPAHGLDAVKDDDFVRGFARQAKAADIPIFLRYASEMNGDWVPWYDDPKKYVEKFRIIANVMKEEAPNVVMVWSPNFLPFDNIDAYYPGDEYVDWVGFSLYSTLSTGSDEELSKNQIDYFIPLYEKYKHKPIMISEGGVSHYNLKTNTSYAKWADGQIGIMYGFLPRMFPQVKAVTYFNMARSRAVSLKMDLVYDIKDNPVMYSLYQRLIKSDYYLTNIKQGIETPDNVKYVPLLSAGDLQGKHKVFTYIRFPLDIQPYAVEVYQGERRLAVSYESPWEVELDFSSLDAAEPVTVAAYNRKYEAVIKKSFPWRK